MVGTPEIMDKQTETFAQSARNAIHTRLSLLPDDELSKCWAIVTKLHAGGLEQTAASLIDAIVGLEQDT